MPPHARLLDEKTDSIRDGATRMRVGHADTAMRSSQGSQENPQVLRSTKSKEGEPATPRTSAGTLQSTMTRRMSLLEQGLQDDLSKRLVTHHNNLLYLQ